MYFEQFYLTCLAHASYMFGSDGEAAVVDPQRDVDIYQKRPSSRISRFGTFSKLIFMPISFPATRSWQRERARRFISEPRRKPDFRTWRCATDSR